jgi:hypothetical protein
MRKFIKQFKLDCMIATLTVASVAPSFATETETDTDNVCFLNSNINTNSVGVDTSKTVLGPNGINLDYTQSPIYTAVWNEINELIKSVNELPAEDALIGTAMKMSGKALSSAASIKKVRDFIPKITSKIIGVVDEVKDQKSISGNNLNVAFDTSFMWVSNLKYDGQTGNCNKKKESDSFAVEMDPKQIAELTAEENKLLDSKEIKTINGIISKSQIAAIAAHISSGTEAGLFKMDMDIVIALPYNFNIDVSNIKEPIVLDEDLKLVAKNMTLSASPENPIHYLHLKIKDLGIDIKSKDQKIATLLQYPTVEITFSNIVSVKNEKGIYAVHSATNEAGLLKIEANKGQTLGVDRVDVKFNTPDKSFEYLLLPQLEWPESKISNLVNSNQAGIGPILSIPYVDISRKSYRLTLNNAVSRTFGLDKTNKKIAENATVASSYVDGYIKGAASAFGLVYDVADGIFDFKNIFTVESSKKSESNYKLIVLPSK